MKLYVFIHRRLRDAISQKVMEITRGSEDTKIMLAGLSNVYTHYITTYEEYQKQRYEGASTIYGPHTLRAYLQQYAYLTEKLLNVSYLLQYICHWHIFSKSSTSKIVC